MEGGKLEKIIICRDVGVDCRFEARALTEDETLTKIMRHVRAVHTWD
jgi:predicted small metal-binding protein